MSNQAEQFRALARLRQQRRQHAQRQVVAQQQVVEQMRGKIDQLQAFIDSPTSPLINGLALNNHAAYTQTLRQLAQWQQQQYLHAEQELAQRKLQLSTRHREEKQVEHYCQAIKEAEQSVQQQRDQKFCDELAALRFSRKG